MDRQVSTNDKTTDSVQEFGEEVVMGSEYQLFSEAVRNYKEEFKSTEEDYMDWTKGLSFHQEMSGRRESCGLTSTNWIPHYVTVPGWPMGSLPPNTLWSLRFVSHLRQQESLKFFSPQNVLGKEHYQLKINKWAIVKIYQRQHSIPSQHRPYFLLKTWQGGQLHYWLSGGLPADEECFSGVRCCSAGAGQDHASGFAEGCCIC